MMRRRWFVIPVLLAIPLDPSAAIAQATSPVLAHTIRGVVYDSIGRRPLAGAVVQAVAVDDARARTFSAIADTTGHFRLMGLPSGRFAIGFQHDALNALGIESPIRAVILAGDTSLMIDLAIPAGPTVRAGVCGKANGAHDGMLAGYVLDPNGATTLPKAQILVQWIEVDLGAGKLRSAPHRVMASVADDGTYHACGIPADGPVLVRVFGKNVHRIETELTLPGGGVARRDFHLVDSSAVRGAAAITIRLVDDAGAAVNGGRAAIPELARDVPVRNGDVVIGDLPAGTWVVTLRTLGYDPQVVVLDATEERKTETITMARTAPVLDTVRAVSGKERRDSLVIRSIQQRLLTAGGTLIQSDNPSIVSATEASDAIRAAAGFVFKGPTKVEARPDRTGAACLSRESATTLGSGKAVAIYLNGERVPGGLEAINQMVPVKDILAVEAYPDITSAPFLWRTNDACAVVGFWTKH